MEIKEVYSGPLSKLFWRRINRIKNERDHGEAYFLGVILQDIEGRCLQGINSILRRNSLRRRSNEVKG